MKKDYSKAYDNANKEKELRTNGFNADEIIPKTIAEEEVKEEPKTENKEKVVKLPFMVEIIGNLNLNVRKKPMGEIFTSLAPGAQAKVLDISEDGKWYQIESPKGFIMKEFTKKVK